VGGRGGGGDDNEGDRKKQGTEPIPRVAIKGISMKGEGARYHLLSLGGQRAAT